jgi:hypothetical protein
MVTAFGFFTTKKQKARPATAMSQAAAMGYDEAGPGSELRYYLDAREVTQSHLWICSSMPESIYDGAREADC